MKTTKDLIKYDIETAVITVLDKKYKDVKITDGASYAAVMFGLGEYRGLRVKIDNKHKELKKDVLEYGRAVDAEKNRLKGLLEPGENHLKAIRQEEDDRKDAIKAEKEAKEKDRIQRIQGKIDDIRHLGVAFNLTSSDIQDRLNVLMAMEISKDVYQEFGPQAFEAQNTAVAELEKALAHHIQFEKEEEARKVEAERLEIVREEQIQAQAKIDAANKKLDEKKAKLEKEAFERDAKARAETYAKEKVEQAERDRLEKEEAEAKEKARKAAKAPDKAKLRDWIDGFNETALPSPQLKSEEAKEILRIAKEQIEMILQDALEKTNKL